MKPHNENRARNRGRTKQGIELEPHTSLCCVCKKKKRQEEDIENCLLLSTATCGLN